MAVSAQNSFLAGLQKATAGITYTPSQIAGLTNVAKARGITDAPSLQVIANAPQRKPVPPVPAPGSNAGVTQQGPLNYSATLPALTPQQQELLGKQRRMNTRQFQETSNTLNLERARAEADAERRRGVIGEDRRMASRQGMQTLAGRGVGRSPMFVNPFERRLATQAQRQIGELEAGLAGTLAQLDAALRQAAITRDRSNLDLDWQRTSFRSDVPGLLGA